MKASYLHYLIFMLALLCFPAIYAKAEVDTRTAIFDPMFRTLTVTVDDDLMLAPSIGLSDGSHITFSFDEITDDRSYLRCRLIHCNADWQPSHLQENEFASGFNYDDIEDYGFSSNTFIHYVNYHYTLPNDRLRPLVSGNLLLQVFDTDDPDTTLLQARFQVSEQSVKLFGEASARTDKGFQDLWQQLSVTADPGQMMIQNPYTDLILVAEQNRHPESRRVIDHPMRLNGSQIVYEHIPQLIFPAGNEYRRFETVRNNYPGMGIDSTRYVEPMYHAWLAVAEPRTDRAYSYDQTQRGRFKIDEYNSTDPDLGADYIMTHFALDFPEITDGDIYVDGELFLNSPTEGKRMRYDRAARLYLLDVPLKQGSYNYRFVARRREGDTRLNASLIEGNKFETTNEYNISLFLRTPGSRADRLLATATLVTR